MSADSSDLCQSNSQPQTKRGFERRLAFVLSATSLFLEKGYDAVALDDIVNHSGGSKASIYKYFGNKKGLFKAICDYRRDLLFKDLFQENNPAYALDLELFLTQTLDNFYQHISTIENQKFIRLLFEQVKSNPDLLEYLYQECPEKILDRVSQQLAYAHENKTIFCENPAYAAQVYLGILWRIEWRLLMGIPPTETDAQIQDYLKYSIELFLKSLKPL
ncbi:TetR/AcrR family transcriptional regulator [Acinetobacter sp. MD2(2019)]|uniref:TetR/AcrR family transcriptional regulator n=1 Tax=Acinetobacter sp. MD2(2019) TaxID=2605273 RepID=UPI002D1F3AE0|nr:TetR/AcrR family transcriptional regulator [Acinetobacter sp. MD2(2019)]MEB3754236.1 TetR/AcrR family transcriptional regulator [Acinetobacter sp. MD2(2019)]